MEIAIIALCITFVLCVVIIIVARISKTQRDKVTQKEAADKLALSRVNIALQRLKISGIERESEWLNSYDPIKEAERKTEANLFFHYTSEGEALEKEGNIEEAITAFEEAITHKYLHCATPFYRLMVLYRKRKDLENEIRVIKSALEIFPHEEKYRERLEKLSRKK